MAFSGTVLAAVTRELKEKIGGGRVEKVHQPGKYEIILSVHRQQKYSLLVSAHPVYSRVHLTREVKENPGSPPPFCMLLRKHLTGGRITGLEQEGMDRVLRITFRTRDGYDLLEEKTLLVEIMGKHSNLILLDQGEKILGGLKIITPEISRHRVIVPGAAYVLPPYREKIDLSRQGSMAPEDLAQGLSPSPDQGISRALVSLFDGLDPLLAAGLAHRARVKPGLKVRKMLPVHLQRLAGELEDLGARVRENRFQPTILLDQEGNYQDFTCLDPVDRPREEKIPFPEMSPLLDTFFAYREKNQRYAQLKQNLVNLVDSQGQKLQEKEEQLGEKLQEARQAGGYRLRGELLVSQLHQLKKGQEKAELINYYHPRQETLTVELDPTLSPGENAQLFFKRYRKLKKALPLLEEEREKARQEQAYLENVRYNLERSQPKELEEIREELARGGYLGRQPKRPSPGRGGKGWKKKAREALPPEPLRFLSTDGFEILVGKNNLQNEYITLRLASREDLWLHVKDLPGSHVVVRGKEPTPRAIEEAALLAAYHSKGASSSRVPVDYTTVKHVRKPRGARPGMVIYDHHKTIYVTPEESLVQQLKP